MSKLSTEETAAAHEESNTEGTLANISEKKKGAYKPPMMSAAHYGKIYILYACLYFKEFPWADVFETIAPLITDAYFVKHHNTTVISC